MHSSFHLCFSILLLFTAHLHAFAHIDNDPPPVGAATLALTHPDTGFPLVIEVFYPAIEGLPSSKAEGLWEMPEVVKNAPIRGSQNQYPLVVMSHGDNGNRFSLAWLAAILADQGYIVASVDHYGAAWPESNPFISIQRWLRPLDLQQAVTALLKDATFKSYIDKERIAVIGFSTGSLSAVWLAGGVADHYVRPSRDRSDPFATAQGLRPWELDAVDFSYAKESYADVRLKAAVLLSPTYGNAFDREGLRTVKIPVLVLAGGGDEVAPLDANANFFGRWINRSILKITNNQAGHYIFLNSPSEKGKELLKRQWIQDPDGVNRKQIHFDAAGEIVDFFTLNLK